MMCTFKISKNSYVYNICDSFKNIKSDTTSVIHEINNYNILFPHEIFNVHSCEGKKKKGIPFTTHS